MKGFCFSKIVTIVVLNLSAKAYKYSFQNANWQNSFWAFLGLGHCSNGISPLKIERETLKGRRFRTVMNIAAASTTLLKYTTTIV